MLLSVWYKDENYRRMILVDRFKNPQFLVNEAQVIKFQQNYVMLQASSSTCTDNFDVYLKIENNKVIDACFVGEGCVISLTSSDLILEEIINKSVPYIVKLLKKYLDLVFNGKISEKDFPENLMIFDQIYKQSNRIICASNVAQKILNHLEGLK
ncbi:iron-sulfur cluster assembly scaffold protein [Mycoplasmoides alvi]|uniref:iron-sulfur cluster assembly scaffold protein n=1 Tax=Mycoplasmoides alvi TaxID=78580 RepID=UPI0009FF946E|nr:iron-sulfur cluster assembly scaffold protein [Mycoplasmoides alvi]